MHVRDSRFVSLSGSLEFIKRFEDGIFAEEDPSLDEVWKGLVDLVVHVRAGRDGEDVVQLFQGALFGLRDPEEYHDQGHYVSSRVEAEDTLFR